MSLFLIADVDECAHSSLCQCSLQAECNNTVGSYQCTCRGGYVDVDPSNPGAHCTGEGDCGKFKSRQYTLYGNQDGKSHK